MRKYRNRLLTGLAIIFVIYVALLVFANTGELLTQLGAFPWILLVPVVLLKFCAWFLRFCRWQYFLGVIKADDKISRLDSAILFVAGFSMAVSPGKIAEVLKAVILKMKTGVPVARSAPVVIAERVVDGVAVLTMSVLAVLLAGDNIQLGDYRYLILLSGALLGFGLAAIQIRPLAYFGLSVLRRLPLAGRIYKPLVEFYESSREILALKHVIPTSFLGALAHTTDALGFCIILSGFGLEITWTLYLQAIFITGLTAAVGALSGVPNGAGITELSSSGMILAVITPQHPGITATIALTVALIDGFFHKWLRVLVGTGAAIVFRHRLFPAALEAELAEMEQERTQQTIYGTESLSA